MRRLTTVVDSSKLDKNMTKLETIKEIVKKIEISDQSEKNFVSLQASKTKLINEIDHLKVKIKEDLDARIVEDSLVDLSQNKIKLEKDQFTNQQLVNLKKRLNIFSSLNTANLKKMSEFNESHEFILNENINSKKFMIGQFKTTYYNKVTFFKLYSL